MRLIDADVLMPNAEYKGKYDTVNAYDIVNCPTIEAEPVVRCKDCKYVIPYESGGFNCLTCPNVDRDVDENWFCADGEKMDEVNDV